MPFPTERYRFKEGSGYAYTSDRREIIRFGCDPDEISEIGVPAELIKGELIILTGFKRKPDPKPAPPRKNTRHRICGCSNYS